MPKLAMPETVADMQEILNTPAKAAEWIREGQFAELIDHYSESTRPPFAEQVAQQLDAFFEGNNVIENKVSDTLNRVLAERGVQNQVQRPPVGDVNDGHYGIYNRQAPGAKMDEIGWGSLGDFAQVVFNRGRGVGEDPRRQQAIEVMNAYSATLDPTTGGFLIPEQFMSDVRQLTLERSIVRPNATVIEMSSLYQLVPYVDETTHADGTVLGGMSFTRIPESGTISATEGRFGRVRLEASKIVGLATVPNELWSDAPALGSFLMNAMPRGLAFQEDVDFLTGSGAGEPLGVTNANNSALITVSAESGQNGSTIVLDNILKIFSRMLPQSLGSAVWIANINTFPELMKLSIPVGTGGSAVNLVDVTAAPRMTLLGRPLYLTEKVPGLGSAGQIGFYDLAFYLLGDRQSAEMASSGDSAFRTDETDIRIISRNDGRPWIQSALTPVNGDTLSPFVQLGAVA